MVEHIDNNEILENLAEIVSDVLGLDNVELKEFMTAQDFEGWDSMSHTKILYECELKWSIRLTLIELTNLKTIGDLVEVIQKKIIK